MNSKLILFVIMSVILTANAETNCLSVSSEEGCEICQKVVGLVEYFAMKNTTENEIKDILYKVCNLTEKYEQTCDVIVGEYFYMIYDLILQEYSPEVICKYLSFCSSELLLTEKKVGNYTLPITSPLTYQNCY